MDCGAEIKRKYILKQLKDPQTIPVCPHCGGRIKTDIILLNEPVSTERLQQAFDMAAQCNLFLILGSSLSVFPANQIPLMARKEGAKLVFINRDPTLMDKYAYIRILGDLSTILTNVVREV